MGGPAAGVLLRHQLSEAELAETRDWLSARVTSWYNPSAELEQDWEFCLEWPSGLGNENPPRTCLMGIAFYRLDPSLERSSPASWSESDLKRVAQALGWMPKYALGVWIGCSQSCDHKRLGWLCAELVYRFDGIVDVGRQLPIPDGNGESPGRLVRVDTEYGIEGKLSETHLIDAAFLRAWLQHPDFYMIK